MQLNNSFIYLLATLTQWKANERRYHLIQELSEGTGVVEVKVVVGVTDITDVTDVTDIAGVRDIAGVMDIDTG